MEPSHNTQGKYNYSEETLSGLHKCQFYGKKFKVQGIKKHEASCKNQQELQKEQAQHHKSTVLNQPKAGPSHTVHIPHEHTANDDSYPMNNASNPLVDGDKLNDNMNNETTNIALNARLNKAQVDGLLTLFSLVSQGKVQVTITTNAELWKFSKHVVSAPYKCKSMEFEVHTQLIWDWALDLPANPQLAPHFIWDAKCIYKHNRVEYEHFYNEPWTCDHWWDIQMSSQLPDNVENAVPFCFILTIKGYPVVVWMLEENAVFQRTWWRKANLAIPPSNDEIIWYLFLLFFILSANYDEQCMMSLIQGQNGKAPCPVCLVPLEELHDLLKTFALCNAGQGEDTLSLGCIPYQYSDPHLALIFDCLHSLHLGLWSKHLFEDLKIILRYLRHGTEATVEGLVKEFPHWCKLSHFKAILKVSFSNGNKLADLSIQVFYAVLNVLTHTAYPEGHLLMSLISSYLQLDSLIGLNIHTDCTLSAIEAELLVFNERLQAYKEARKKSSIPGLKVDWDFPKTHLWRHVLTKIIQIRETFPARNGVHSNNGNNDDLLLDFKGHFKLRSLCKPTTIQEIKIACDTKDKAYLGFQRKFTKYINEFLPSIGHGLTRWLVILHHFKMCEYHYLKINYKSWVDWTMATNYSWCNPEFYSAPHYNCAYIQLTSMQMAFVHLVSIFTCQIDNFGEVQLVVVQPYTAGIGQQCRLDQNMKLMCIRAVPRGSIIQDTLVFTDPQKKDKFLVVDYIDSDIHISITSMAGTQPFIDNQNNSFEMLHPNSDEDFTSNIGAINDEGSSQGEQVDYGQDNNGSESGSDVEKMWKALCMPGLTTDVQELRKALSFVQQAYFETQNDLQSSSPETMADETVEKLYEVIPMELHKQMETYKPFASLFCKTVNTECSNLVKAIKENTALLFTPLGLTVNILSSQSASKATNNELLLLLKQPENLGLDGKYECLALILFTNPKNMSPNTLLKSRILLNGSLMIFELSPEGNNMKIPYHNDFNFYLKLLFKCNNWSREVMDYYNEGVFRHKALSQVSQLEPAPVVPQSHSWEDDFLDEMDWDPDVPPSITPPA
ncbi:hypothetical protein J3A83DRAFT_4188499 [Scleroderma citrinum]